MCVFSAAIGGISAATLNASLAMAAISTATSVGMGVSSANAQTRQNERAAETAARARALEQAKMGAQMRQSAEAATRKKLGIEQARIATQGRVAAQAAETGARGNFLEAIQRNVNLQAGDKVSAVQAQQALNAENARFGNIESNQRLAGRIAGLPEAPNMGLTIGTGLATGFNQGISTLGGLHGKLT